MITKAEIEERSQAKTVVVRIDALDDDVTIKKLTFREVMEGQKKSETDAWLTAFGVLDDKGEPMFTVKEVKDLPGDIFIPLRDAVLQASGLGESTGKTEKN